MSSAAKVAALGKYLVAISAASAANGKIDEPPKSEVKQKAPRRKQMYILYLFNDLLHESKHHRQTEAINRLLTENTQNHVADIFAHATAHDRIAFPQHYEKLKDLVRLWEKHHYYDSSYLQELRNIIADPSAAPATTESQRDVPIKQSKSSNEPLFEMPATHGDPGAPFHELPAATMLPHIIPNSKVPIDPRRMKALHFNRGPADQPLVSAVKTFLREANMIYGLPVEEDDEVNFRLDELGQTLYVDKLTGEVIGGESYYGWSTKFCERIKQKKQQARGRSGSHSRSRSKDQSPRKRRRSFATSRSQSRSLSRSRARSPGPRFRSNGRRESQSPYRGRYSARSRSRSISHAQRRDSHSPPKKGNLGYSSNNQSSPPFLPSTQQSNAASQAFPFPFSGGIPLGPDGLPIPPPRPPHWSGPWPPPPPPPGGFPSSTSPFPGFVPPPPPINHGSRPGQQWPPRPPQNHQGTGPPR
jgi:CID domain